jgi:hypothetical protein
MNDERQTSRSSFLPFIIHIHHFLSLVPPPNSRYTLYPANVWRGCHLNPSRLTPGCFRLPHDRFKEFSRESKDPSPLRHQPRSLRLR